MVENDHDTGCPSGSPHASFTAPETVMVYVLDGRSPEAG
jgi:hypothetical protein